VVLPNSRLQIYNHFVLILILAEWASPVFNANGLAQVDRV
jgi:hypothetical protein